MRVLSFTEWRVIIALLTDNRELKQTDAAAANLQITVQKDSRPSEFRPLTSITLNLNRDMLSHQKHDNANYYS